ncbi:hypothetical protein AVEN_51245-1 [Araneus ventricosus]|uniref:Uncharacterized protein n=1 Tax=Araneus ventricosus TaxID=182803 RepID=A0A4Y2UUQ9_ARAVE|nr:hypothetical protein AVEN_51245-1 [Araneus ventricosus]
MIVEGFAWRGLLVNDRPSNNKVCIGGDYDNGLFPLNIEISYVAYTHTEFHSRDFPLKPVIYEYACHVNPTTERRNRLVMCKPFRIGMKWRVE